MSIVTMSRQEREEFLAGLHVGVMAIGRPDLPPLTVPIWYDYEPGGEVTVLTSSKSLKGQLLEEAGGFSLCAQTEEVPYRYDGGGNCHGLPTGRSRNRRTAHGPAVPGSTRR